MCGSHKVPDFADFSPKAELNFLWNDIDGKSFSSLVKSCYDEIVHWRRNVFKVLCGKISASFVCEQAKLFQAYSDSSALESVALYAAMIMPSLLLQGPPGKLRAKELSRLLDHYLTIWLSGNLASLLQEGRAIQARLTITRPTKNTDNLSQKFSNLMFVGNVNAAIDNYLIMKVVVFTLWIP